MKEEQPAEQTTAPETNEEMKTEESKADPQPAEQ